VSDTALSSTTAPRDSGIDLLGQLAWGSHICLFHETKDDLLEIVVPFFAAGLLANEFCIWLVAPPLTPRAAEDALRQAMPDFDRRLAAGQIEILSGDDWYFTNDRMDPEESLRRLDHICRQAMAAGYDGLRGVGNPPITPSHRASVLVYEQLLHRALAERNAIAICAFPLSESHASDVLNTVRAHGTSISRRNGTWEVLQSPDRPAPETTSAALDHPTLTPRERVALEQIVRGHTTKEAARSLGISPRTVEFHRANIMRKLGARNIADLVRRALGEANDAPVDERDS
jgi:DNA-binding CsgD family transcriptional regulator